MVLLTVHLSKSFVLALNFHPIVSLLDGWSFFCHLDKEDAKSSANSPAAGGVSAARELFKNKTARGQDNKNDTDTIRTLHERAITLIQDASPKAGAGVTRISTSSLDGKLIEWDLPALEIDMATLGL